MNRNTLKAPKRKRWCRLQKEAPFPVPIATINNETASLRNWYYYEGELVGRTVFIKHTGDMQLLYNMGFFGKGTVSRWGIKTLQERGNQDRDALKIMKKQRYLRHCRWRHLADIQEGRMMAEDFVDTDEEEKEMARFRDKDVMEEEFIEDEEENGMSDDDEIVDVNARQRSGISDDDEDDKLDVSQGHFQGQGHFDSQDQPQGQGQSGGQGHSHDWNDTTEEEAEEFWAATETKTEISAWDATDEKAAESFWGETKDSLGDEEGKLGQSHLRSSWDADGDEVWSDVSGGEQNDKNMIDVDDAVRTKSDTVKCNTSLCNLSSEGKGEGHLASQSVIDSNISASSQDVDLERNSKMKDPNTITGNNIISERTCDSVRTAAAAAVMPNSDNMTQDGSSISHSRTGASESSGPVDRSQCADPSQSSHTDSKDGSKFEVDIPGMNNTESNEENAHHFEKEKECDKNTRMTADERSLVDDVDGDLFVKGNDKDDGDISDVAMDTRMKWRPCRKRDPYKVVEYLCLSLEEAFFLSYGLGCLIIRDESKKTLSLTEMWQIFCSRQQSFLNNYIAYHSLRSRGWVPKTGIKYGAEFILYKQGPPFYHSSYSVMVRPVKEDDLKEEKLLSWTSLSGMNRITEQVAKEVLLCYVIRPSQLTAEDTRTPACIPKFKIMEVILERWVAPQERENQTEQQIP